MGVVDRMREQKYSNKTTLESFYNEKQTKLKIKVIYWKTGKLETTCYNEDGTIDFQGERIIN